MKTNLKKIRLAQGLSRPQLSNLSNVPLRTIEDIELKSNVPKIDTLRKIKKALNVSWDELLEVEEQQ